MGSAYVPKIEVENRLLVASIVSDTSVGPLVLLKVGSEVYPGGYRLDLGGGGYRNFYVATAPAVSGVANHIDIFLVCYSLSYTESLPEITFSNLGVYIVGNS